MSSTLLINIPLSGKFVYQIAGSVYLDSFLGESSDLHRVVTSKILGYLPEGEKK